MNQEVSFTDQIIKNLGINSLNEMQVAALKSIESKGDIQLLSNTGSGKTIAFLLGIIARIDTSILATQALIIVPTRELAQQIELVFKKMGTLNKITSCYGGHKRETEENNLIEAPTVIVGTSGRLRDHINRGNINTSSIHTLVIDEYDKILELGFAEELEFIVAALPNIEKRILTSATSAQEIPHFIGIKDLQYLNFLLEEELPVEKLAIQKIVSTNPDKVDTLFQLICYLGDKSTIIFCNHRESVERVSTHLAGKGIINEFYHGAMEQQERDSALCKFRNGSVNVLVTTDLASRGLDIANIRYVIHYHLPHSEDIFTHRNGRTARMDATGTVIILLSEKETLPEYVDENIDSISLPTNLSLPDKPKWTTLFIAAGKKDKVNKIDIVGFLSAKGELKKEDIGLIEVKDFFSFVAIRKNKVSQTLQLIRDEKIKNKKVKIEVAK